MKLTAIILAGGKSSRMGQIKRLINYKGKPMVEYAIDTCKKLTNRMINSTNNKYYEAYGYPLIQDKYTEGGPIGGLEAALSNSLTEDNLVCPSDMPDMHSEIFEQILQSKNRKQAAVVGNKQGKIFPVLGYYNRSALPVIRQQIATGNYKKLSLLKLLKAEVVVISADSMLSNVNIMEDLQ